MIIEFEINGARVIVSGDNLSISLTDEDSGKTRNVFAPDQPTGLQAIKRWMKSEKGRQKVLAEKLGIASQSISQWSRIPADKILTIESVSGIKRQVLRPDLFEGMAA